MCGGCGGILRRPRKYFALISEARLTLPKPGGEQLLLANCVKPLPSLSALPPGSPDRSRGSSPLNDSGYSSGTPSDNAADPRPLIHRTSSLVSSVLSSDGGSVREDVKVEPRDATKAFFGGMNNHSIAARERMRSLRVARLAME
jgi:stearoyl-CoA desaturase (delta-9 desaturase)